MLLEFWKQCSWYHRISFSSLSFTVASIFPTETLDSASALYELLHQVIWASESEGYSIKPKNISGQRRHCTDWFSLLMEWLRGNMGVWPTVRKNWSYVFHPINVPTFIWNGLTLSSQRKLILWLQFSSCLST